jgi:hypothetical protein
MYALLPLAILIKSLISQPEPNKSQFGQQPIFGLTHIKVSSSFIPKAPPLALQSQKVSNRACFTQGISIA